MTKKITISAWTVAIAIAGITLTACSLDDYETEKPILIIDPVEIGKLEARGYTIQPTSDSQEESGVVFTDDDIEWFDVNTRELRFRDMEQPLYEKISLLSGIEFRVNDMCLFSGSTFVGLICSQVFDDLVLCCGKIEDDGVIDNNRYYLYDCYPPQMINDEQVQANRAKRAEQWDFFLHYLEYKGKLRR